jgi:transposase
MPKEIDWEIRERAEELYVVDGLTFEETAKETGVSVNQLKNWSAAEGWREKREEYRAAKKNIRSMMMTLRQNLAKEAAASTDPQKIFAFIRLEALAEKKEKRQEGPALKIDRPALFMEAIEFIAAFLKDNDPEGLKILANNFDKLIETFKAKHAQTT